MSKVVAAGAIYGVFSFLDGITRSYSVSTALYFNMHSCTYVCRIRDICITEILEPFVLSDVLIAYVTHTTQLCT